MAWSGVWRHSGYSCLSTKMAMIHSSIGSSDIAFMEARVVLMRQLSTEKPKKKKKKKCEAPPL